MPMQDVHRRQSAGVLLRFVCLLQWQFTDVQYCLLHVRGLPLQQSPCNRIAAFVSLLTLAERKGCLNLMPSGRGLPKMMLGFLRALAVLRSPEPIFLMLLPTLPRPVLMGRFSSPITVRSAAARSAAARSKAARSRAAHSALNSCNQARASRSSQAHISHHPCCVQVVAGHDSRWCAQRSPTEA